MKRITENFSFPTIPSLCAYPSKTDIIESEKPNLVAEPEPIVFQFKTILHNKVQEELKDVCENKEQNILDVSSSQVSINPVNILNNIKDEKDENRESVVKFELNKESSKISVPKSSKILNSTPILPHEELQYLNLIRDILENGSYEKGRNGNTYTKFGHSMRFSLKDGIIPLLTTKKLAWRVCFEELFWFLRGSTSNFELQSKNVHIWDANASREFLDSRGLYFLEENDLGPIYGFQWRHFNADYTNHHKCYQGEGIDQLQEIIENLKNPETRSSRRLIMTAWNPCQLNGMALPPCHVMAQFHVREGKYLSCALFQRSGDVGLGVPFNIASYSLLTHILAKHCDLEADEFVHFLGNCHIYEQHIEPLRTQLLREPKEFPKISIENQYDSIEEYHLGDISWKTPYEYHPSIKMEMIA